MKLLVVILSMLPFKMVDAHDLSIKVSSHLDESEKKVLEYILNDVSALLPKKFKDGLPKDIEVTIEKLSDHKVMPEDICNPKEEKSPTPFVYGKYEKYPNKLVLNIPVYAELANGPLSSSRINCQHKTLYDQAFSAIIHELGHAYDLNNNYISKKNEFIRRAGFKQGLLKTKNKNINAIRSVDLYELTNIMEAFAVNMEYFIMDPEYACRKPSMFDYYKGLFGTDPYPNRNCTLNNVVMVSTSFGFSPISLDLKRLYRIDYLLASPGRELISGFGHSMFRLVMCAPEHFDSISNTMIAATPYGPKCLDDKIYHLVVSYRANVEGATLNYFKGLFGGYPSMLFILNFVDILDEYNRDELRDVVAYPLRISEKDKEDFIKRVMEEHWNYRGSYKFFTNNCAVESYDLLKNALGKKELENFSSLTPAGVLEDLDRLEFVSLRSEGHEFFKAQTTQLILAHKKAYSHNAKEKGEISKKSLLKFVAESSAEYRLNIFNKYSQGNILFSDLHDQVTSMKSDLIRFSSFSVLEQQILRYKTMEFRKKLSEYFMNEKDDRLKRIFTENDYNPMFDFSKLAPTGYGVPLLNEIMNQGDNKKEIPKDIMASFETTLREILPGELEEINLINKNIKLFNQKSLVARKMFREKLEDYVHQFLADLFGDEKGKMLLVGALETKDGLDKIRTLLDKDLVSEKEILDVKLRKIIEDLITR